MLFAIRGRSRRPFPPRLLALFVVVAVIPTPSARGQQPVPPAATLGTQPTQETATPVPPKVRQVHIVTENIFDLSKPGEDRALFRLANRFHLITRPEVIERQVLLKPDDDYSPEEAAESERILRQNPYLYDAKVRAVPVGDGQVDLDVVTRDVWTLQGGVGFRRSGGTNTVHFNVEDTNFLGTGKTLAAWHQSSVDRTSNLIR